MSNEKLFVIVGGGLAGAKTAEQLRARDFPGRILLLGAEEHLPYERPPLSKEYFAGTKQLEDFTVQHGDWYRDHRVEVELGVTVTALDPGAHTVTLPDGSTVRYDKLALATGSRPRRILLPGIDAAGVHMLRTVEQSDALLAAVRRDEGPAPRLAIVGAGWIGLEIAAGARGHGADVTVVEAAAQPLSGALGEQMGAVFADLHRSHGVDLRLSTTVSEILTVEGRATGLRLGDGTEIRADAVLVAVGGAAQRRTRPRRGTDRGERRRGSRCVSRDERSRHRRGRRHRRRRASAAADRIRVEHWANALNQPDVAAATMLGRPASYDRLPYFFTDQYDLGMEYVGHAPAETRVITRGDVGSRQFLAFWLDAAGRVRAGMNVNIWDAGDDIRALISSGESVDPHRLSDPQVPLAEVAG